jgi:hypothetical protein
MLWRERPAVIHHWLQAPATAWGTYPILTEEGMQCTSVSEVDVTVRKFWVDNVLRRHASVDETQSWATLRESEFYPFIPKMRHAVQSWTGAKVGSVLGHLREGAAPGLPGIPIAVWKVLPPMWMDAIARLLNMVEAEGRWPVEWLRAYVVMVPKASGGVRPQDQRPITILPVLYRLWSKGVSMDWAAEVQNVYLGPAAMGFRAQAGTLCVAQLLSDVIAICKRTKKELWLVSFDIEKAYDTIPWWALFKLMRQAGIASTVVNVFEYFSKNLQRCFRYGEVDGIWWQAANSLMQGCPAAQHPDGAISSMGRSSRTGCHRGRPTCSLCELCG